MDSRIPPLQISARTDVGCVRSHNEDSIAWDSTAGWALLADGMGGHNAGEVASALAVEVLRPLLGEVPEDSLEQEVALHNAVADANSAILQRSTERPSYRGMGTTLALVQFRDNNVMVGHVGDSRVYRLRGGSLQALTADHSLLVELVRDGLMSETEAREAVGKNVITRALGIETIVDLEVSSHDIAGGDIYLLCSDGLSDLVCEELMARILEAGRDNLEQAADQLVAEAKRSGGNDNISVILVRVKTPAGAAG